MSNFLPRLSFSNWVVFTIFFLLFLPAAFVQGPVDHSHFYSSHHMFEYAFYNGFQFGVDIIDNVGPYGFLHYPYTYTGGAYWVKIGWFALVGLIFSYYCVLFSQAITGKFAKALFLATAFYFPLHITNTWYSYEAIPRLTLMFAALALIYFGRPVPSTNSRKPLLWLVAVCAFYGFLLNQKIGNLYIIAGITILLTLFWLLQKRFLEVFLYTISLIGFGIGFWMLAGQELSNIPTFLVSSYKFSEAYAGILATNMDNHQGFMSAFIWLVCISGLAWRLVNTRKNSDTFIKEVFSAAIVFMITFLSWKHGNLRNIASYGIFLFIMPTVLIWIFVFTPWKITLRQQRVLGVCAILTFAILHVYTSHNNRLLKAGPSHFFDEISNRLYEFVHLSPFENRKKMDTKIEELKKDVRLTPEIRSKLSTGTVDELGDSPEIVLLNNLNYWPRPVPIRYIAVGKSLGDLNFQHYSDYKKAPDFVFIRANYLPIIADRATQLVIDFNYTTVARFKDWIIKEKKSLSSWKLIRFKPKRTVLTTFDYVNNLKFEKDALIWLSASFSPTLKHKLISFLFKPTSLDLILEKDGNVHPLSSSSAAFEQGFLLSPMLDFVNSANWGPPSSIQFKQKSRSSWPDYDDQIELRFSDVIVE